MIVQQTTEFVWTYLDPTGVNVEKDSVETEGLAMVTLY